MSVVLGPLLGKLSREFALPLVSADVVPRVDGVGHHHFFRTTRGTYGGALSDQPCSSGIDTSSKSRACAHRLIACNGSKLETAM